MFSAEAPSLVPCRSLDIDWNKSAFGILKLFLSYTKKFYFPFNFIFAFIGTTFLHSATAVENSYGFNFHLLYVPYHMKHSREISFPFLLFLCLGHSFFISSWGEIYYVTVHIKCKLQFFFEAHNKAEWMERKERNTNGKEKFLSRCFALSSSIDLQTKF